MTKARPQIDFVSIDNGAIHLYAGDKRMGLSNSPFHLASMLQRWYGSYKIAGSSLFLEAIGGCDDAAQEGGFSTAKEVADLWDETCANV